MATGELAQLGQHTMRALREPWLCWMRCPPGTAPQNGGDAMWGEAETRGMKEVFVATGDDPPAIDTAVRDTRTWVLGGITTEA